MAYTFRVRLNRDWFNLGLANARGNGGRYDPETQTWTITTDDGNMWFDATYHPERMLKRWGWMVVDDEPVAAEPVAVAATARDTGTFADCHHYVASRDLLMQGDTGTCCPNCYDRQGREGY